MHLNDLRIPNEKAFISEQAVAKVKALNPAFHAQAIETFYQAAMPAIFHKGTHVLFTVPGAYTPQCSEAHLPGYVRDADHFMALGVDALWCMAVNDPFVLERWVRDSDPESGKVFWISDSSADVSRSMNLAICMAGIGFGTRARRAAVLIKDGRILHVSLEPPAQFYISSSEYMLKVVEAYLK
jgi:peroxiredoxin